MYANDKAIDKLQQECADLDLTIRQQQLLHDMGSALALRWSTRSSNAWLMTLGAEDIGTVLAVEAGDKAETWKQWVNKIEGNMHKLQQARARKQAQIEAARQTRNWCS